MSKGIEYVNSIEIVAEALPLPDCWHGAHYSQGERQYCLESREYQRSKQAKMLLDDYKPLLDALAEIGVLKSARSMILRGGKWVRESCYATEWIPDDD